MRGPLLKQKPKTLPFRVKACLLEGNALLVTPRGDNLVEGKHQLERLALHLVLR